MIKGAIWRWIEWYMTVKHSFNLMIGGDDRFSETYSADLTGWASQVNIDQIQRWLVEVGDG